MVDGRDVIGPNVHVVDWVPDFFTTRHSLGPLAVDPGNHLSKEFQLQGFGFEVSPDVRFEKPDGEQVWSLTQFYSVDFSKSRIGVSKSVFNKRTIKVCVF